jgi:redox-sensitive bicupin YhaK (pirin superfamily)
VESGDGTDDSGVIGDGDAPRMSAGGGRYHLKMPKVDSNGYTHGLQLWANLPASYKMRLPRYRSILDKEIPSVGVSGGATVKVIAGKVGGAIGPVHDAEYLDVTIPPHSEFIHRTMSDHIVFAYIIKGRGFFCKEKHSFSDEGEGANHLDIREDPFVDHATLVLFDDGDQVIVSTEINPVRFFLVSGKSMREPAAWYGPVVMNTREEFQGAF